MEPGLTVRSPSVLRALTQRPKPAIDILLKDEEEKTPVHFYTTLDRINGEVSITAPSDMRFDTVEISFMGDERTLVENLSTTAPTSTKIIASRPFLELKQPINTAAFPQHQVAQAGHTYRLPFMFVIPEHLLPQACRHPVDNDQLREAHLSLPPSLGDPMAPSDGKTLMDDLAPDMSTISYAVKVKITRNRKSGGKPVILADVAKKIRVIPAYDEHPPLNVLAGKDDGYCLRKEKDLKKGMFKGKLGRLTVEAAQPRSLHLHAPRSENRVRVTTMATMNLRFDPAEESAQPPRLGQLVTKLKAATFFASVPMREIPSNSAAFRFDHRRGLYVETLNLSSRNVESVQWVRHTASHDTERGSSAHSVSSAVSIPDASSVYIGKAYYTASIVVPITLPENKSFVPTFHTCLISRTYLLDFSLSVHSPGKSVSASIMHLKVPVQVSSERNANAQPLISPEEARAIAARDADGYFVPRSVAPPSPEYTERAELVRPAPQVTNLAMESAAQPPEYAFLGSHAQGMAFAAARPICLPSACC
ncbi:Bul1, N-terminal [Lasallia pustulata]|uniref:Bul1, N-terminal n=1 Tax=Lasallia pustulata TaxID=136370 RepID=A0A1W5D114_9LECA|nr:Bul1, N-terminal [Lasallia pustulata]